MPRFNVGSDRRHNGLSIMRRRHSLILILTLRLLLLLLLLMMMMILLYLFGWRRDRIGVNAPLPELR